jgi:predicted RNA binding protein YcfA (HicA-like mRNA interferase family)
MSPALPVVSGQEAIRAFVALGYEIVRRRGSHVRLRHPSDPRRKPLTVPDHRTLKPGLLRALIRDANLDVGTLIRLVRGDSV